MEISNEQRGVKDSSSCFIYGNSTTKKFKRLLINYAIELNHEQTQQASYLTSTH